MNEIECTCKSHTCYSCRRQVIDATAERIAERELRLCKGMSGFVVEAHAWRMANDWRCKAITSLAFELMN